MATRLSRGGACLVGVLMADIFLMLCPALIAVLVLVGVL